jgi:hypothetical protein
VAGGELRQTAAYAGETLFYCLQVFTHIYFLPTREYHAGEVNNKQIAVPWAPTLLSLCSLFSALLCKSPSGMLSLVHLRLTHGSHRCIAVERELDGHWHHFIHTSA